jgi:hypothetical protein
MGKISGEFKRHFLLIMSKLPSGKSSIVKPVATLLEPSK